jgi:cytochrome c-type biogenesis protein CcsB
LTDVKLDLDLAQQSLVFVFASMVVYTVSFLIFAWHLTNIASNKGSGKVISNKLENIGFALFGFGALIHGAGVVMRGIAASRVPWANMYEFSISGSFVLVFIYLAFYRLRDIRIIAAFVNGFVLLILGAATTYFYVQVKTLMPALQSYWLVIHVSVAVLATAFFNIAAALSVAYLLRTSTRIASSTKKFVVGARRVLEFFPAEKTLERLQVRFNAIGLILWTFTLAAGAIWAERAWHRYWGWDTKEVWTFIIWVLYAGYFHATATRGWTGRRAAWLSLVGFASVLFNFTIVNLFFKGLHVYSGL